MKKKIRLLSGVMVLFSMVFILSNTMAASGPLPLNNNSSDAVAIEVGEPELEQVLDEEVQSFGAAAGYDVELEFVGYFNENDEPVSVEQVEALIESQSVEMNTEELNSDTLQPAAAGPDLKVTQLNPTATPPLSNTEYSQFYFKVQNIGSTAITKEYEAVLSIDSQSIMTYNGLAPLPAGYSAGYNMLLICREYGRHTIKIHVNPDRKVFESNYTNNSLSGSFQFGARLNPDLTLMNVTHDVASGLKIGYTTTYVLRFSVQGNVVLTGFQYAVYLGGVKQFTTHLSGTFEPGTTWTFRVSMILTGGGGNYNLKFELDPSNYLGETNRSDNALSITKLYYLYKAPETWHRNKTLNIKITGTDTTWKNRINAGFTTWNNSGVGVKVNASTTSSDYITTTRKNDDWIGLYSFFYANYFSIQINLEVWDMLPANIQENWAKSTVVHEIGHAFGLIDNPKTEGQASIMTYQYSYSDIPYTTLQTYDKNMVKDWFNYPPATSSSMASANTPEQIPQRYMNGLWQHFDEFEQMVEYADVVVFDAANGATLDYDTDGTEPLPYTYNSFSVKQVLAGADTLPNEITVKQLGHNITSPCEGMTYMQPGEEYVLLLRAYDDGMYALLNPEQGMYSVTAGRDVIRFAENPVEFAMDLSDF